MNRILFAGACDKHDLLLYISKIVGKAGQKVLLIDATRNQKYKFVVPLTKEDARLTEFDGFDVALGFYTFDELKDYLLNTGETIEAYDMLLIDTDEQNSVNAWGNYDHRLLFTNFERYTISNNVLLLESFFQERPTEMLLFEQVIYPYVECRMDASDLEATLDHLPIRFGDNPYEFWMDEVDYSVGVMNQYESRLTFKRLSRSSKRRLKEICQAISGLNARSINSALRQAERGK